MSRYINHGSFGARGVDLVGLRESRGSKVFFADYYEKGTGRRLIRSLKTTDLDTAKKMVADLIEQKGLGGRGASSHEREMVLYVVQRGDDGPIKVGISRNLKGRIKSLQTGSAEKLKILRVYKMADVERAVHAELEKNSRLEGEWFPADLLSLVDRFFNVATEVVFQRSQKQYEARTAKVEHLARAGLL